jgi:hypothetical protein
VLATTTCPTYPEYHDLLYDILHEAFEEEKNWKMAA